VTEGGTELHPRSVPRAKKRIWGRRQGGLSGPSHLDLQKVTPSIKLRERKSLTPGTKRLFKTERLFKAAVAAAGIALLWIQITRLPLRVVEAAVAVQVNSKSPVPPASGAAVYAANCATCHGKNREGTPPAFPSLIGVKRKLSDEQIARMIHDGKAPMPPFPNMPKDQINALLSFLGTSAPAPQKNPQITMAARKGIALSPQAAAGEALFQQNCAFCHGRDAMGGESGPDLTRSKLVSSDTDGSKIAQVIREGRTTGEKRMPAFQLSSSEVAALIAFIRARVAIAEATKGSRRGVDVSDLQTGNAELGKQYFNGAGGCAKCHSPTGDLAGIASRYEGLQLEERMLYPRNVKSTLTVTLPDGKTISGPLAYRDEFTIALTDSSGTYRSWPTDSVSYKVDSPVDAHVDLFSRYTDEGIHNLMAYIQTLR
jgi:mono/diheme cytochrome c family protein